MSFYPDQRDIDILFQHQKHIYSKVEILNANFLVVSSIEGELISDNLNVDSSSNIRRSYSCVIQIESSTLDFSKTGIIWFDKYIRPYVGMYDYSKKEIVWYLKGTFSSVNATGVYSDSDNTLSLTCNDLMCRLTGDLDGVVPLDPEESGNYGQFVIPAGSDIAESIVGVIKPFGFTEYNIEPLPRTVQYDLEFAGGATAYDMISALMEFCPNYEFFFDLYGVFTVQRIPCYTDDGDILDNYVLDRLLIEESAYSVNFNAKNCIEIWGKTFDDNSIDRFAESCTYNRSSNIYNVTFETIPASDPIPYENMVFAVDVPEANKSGFRMSLSETESGQIGTYSVVNDYGESIPANTLEANITYVFMYENGHILFLGSVAIHAIYENHDKSKFSVEDMGKKYWGVFSGGEYDNITSDALAKERAMYECYYKGNLSETLSLNLVDIPWLDVNKKIKYKRINTIYEENTWVAIDSLETEVDVTRIVKDIGGSLHERIERNVRSLSDIVNPANGDYITIDGVKYIFIGIERWLINSLSSQTLSGTVNVSLSKFYPDWSEVFHRD